MFKFCEFRISRPLIVISKFDDIRKKSTVPFLNYKPLKLQRVFFAGNTVAMVTYCVTKIILNNMFSNDWAVFDSMIVASTDKE